MLGGLVIQSRPTLGYVCSAQSKIEESERERVETGGTRKEGGSRMIRGEKEREVEREEGKCRI